MQEDPSFGQVFEVPEKRGWMWKFSIGKSFFSRKNWKMRYFICDFDGIAYYANEPFDTPKGTLLWQDVTHVYQTVTKDVDAEASDPKKAYFGIRFYTSPGTEKLLLLRCDSDKERDEWAEHLNEMRNEVQRVSDLVETDEEEDDAPSSRSDRRSVPRKGVFMTAVSNKLRTMVSLKKQRYKKDGIDLDLAYITPNVIAMGYPAEGREAVYRNPMEEVVHFFDQYHKNKFFVYNLCSERSYPPSRFEGSFERFPFDDHNPCPLEMLYQICRHMDEYIKGDPGSAVAVHCKAGKGRTGLVICCYLIYAGQVQTADEALKHFGDTRTKDGKGVQIPSQKRYIRYFHQLHKVYNGITPTVSQVIVTRITLFTTPHFDPDGGCDPYLLIEQRKQGHNHVPKGKQEGKFNKEMELVFDGRKNSDTQHIVNVSSFTLPIGVELSGTDFRFTMYDLDSLSKDDKMFSFWVHTAFLPAEGKLTINKDMLDDAVKDKKDQLFEDRFAITLEYRFGN